MDSQLVGVDLFLPVDLQRDLRTSRLARALLQDGSSDGVAKKHSSG